MKKKRPIRQKKIPIFDCSWTIKEPFTGQKTEIALYGAPIYELTSKKCRHAQPFNDPPPRFFALHSKKSSNNPYLNFFLDFSQLLVADTPMNFFSL